MSDSWIDVNATTETSLFQQSTTMIAQKNCISAMLCDQTRISSVQDAFEDGRQIRDRLQSCNVFSALLEIRVEQHSYRDGKTIDDQFKNHLFHDDLLAASSCNRKLRIGYASVVIAAGLTKKRAIESTPRI